MKLHLLSPDPRCLTMGCVFETDNKHYLVIDGGLDESAGSASAGYLMEELRRITGRWRPFIDAWIFTHPHSDHINEFSRICEQYSDVDFGVRNLYFHFPDGDFAASESEGRTTLPRFRRAVNRLFHDETAFDTYPSVRVGDTFELDGLRVEFLRVSDENLTDNPLNNSSLVFRITAEGQTYLFLGDLGAEGGDQLAAMYGEALASDVCQMAHHGQWAVRSSLYDLIAPKICLFFTPQWVWDNVGPDGPGTGKFEVRETLRWPAVAPARHIVTCLTGACTLELPIPDTEAR